MMGEAATEPHNPDCRRKEVGGIDGWMDYT